MRIALLLLFGFSTVFFAQKKKNVLDVVSNIEVKMIAMKPLGNNHLAKLLMPFYGFGFGGNLITPINFGVGVDYNVLFSNVKYGEQNRPQPPSPANNGAATGHPGRIQSLGCAPALRA